MYSDMSIRIKSMEEVTVFNLHSVEFSLFLIQLLLSVGQFSLSHHQTSLLQSQVGL